MALTVFNRLYRRLGRTYPVVFLTIELQSAFVITAATLGLFSFYYNASAHDYLRILVVTMILVALAVGITIVRTLPLMRPIQEWIAGARDTKYVAEAHRLGLRALRIIHGRGIGVQREAVRAVLGRSAFVAAFRDAPAEAGGWGATIVDLRD